MLSYVSLYSLLVLSSCLDLHDKVFRNLLRFCPEQFVPGDNGTAVNHTSESGSCCTDYFNDSAQVQFDSNKKFPGENERTCLFPRTDGQPGYQTENSFYMITHPPNDGCLLPENHTATITNEFYKPTCNDSEVIPFMKLLPVSSNSNGLIYKNPHCASCHGQYDVMVWQPYATCYQAYAFSYDLDECVFNFVYPGDYDDIRHLECSTDKFSECPTASFINPAQGPLESDLSVDEIATACSMPRLPRFAHMYVAKNVFCYICRFNRPNRFPIPECSNPTALGPGRSPSARRFTRLIDTGLIQQIEGSKLGHPPGKTVCGRNGDKKVCHEVLCPLGQVMNTDEQAGDELVCKMESTKWVTAKFEMLLLLQFGGSIDVDDSSLENMFTHDQPQNPWRKSWVIISVHRPVFEYDKMMIEKNRFHIYNISNGQELDAFSHVFVQLYSRDSSVASSTLIRNIQETLTKPWYLKKNGKTYKAKQTLSRYTLKSVTASLGKTDRMSFMAPFGQLPQTVLSQKRSLYKTVFENIKIRTSGFLLNKLHMCQQVELSPEHFNVTVYLSTPAALYHHRTGSILFDSEFVRLKGFDGESLFRICVSDTKIKSTSNNRLRLSPDNHLNLLILVFYTCHQLLIHI